MRMRKYIIFLLIFINIVGFTKNIYADDIEIEEDSDSAWIYEQIEAASSTENNEPIINSRAAVIYDRSSGEVIWGKDENTERKMASTTKIMTAIIVIENVQDMGNVVTVSSKAAGIGGSRLRTTYWR